MFNHIVYVSNRILLLAKREGIDKKTLTSMGKYLWRLVLVLQAYNSKKRDITLDSVLSIVVEFKGVFSG